MKAKAKNGKVISINVSEKTGIEKVPVKSAELKEEFGIVGDAHAGDKRKDYGHRQISLLAKESIDKMANQGVDLYPGIFAENLTTEGITLTDLPIGTTIKFPGGVTLEVTQIGKECHDGCAIFQAIGDCVMPKEGIFTRVVVGGTISAGDEIEILQ
jgi:MOSC domain-containing protein YiiM